ncbi:MAG TPA: phage baseplate assembly protein V [Pararobbsia sp.]|nr:phage baseplate assembly protein V [Pararobbsia sp.]
MDTNEINRLILNIVRKGVVDDISHASTPPKCRVSFGDLQSNWLPWLALAAGDTRDWDPPTFGEQVVVLCPGGDPAQGVVLRGLYSEHAPAPTHTPYTRTRVYPDGALIEYDHDAHSLTAELPAGATVTVVAPGSVNVQTQNATVKAEHITLDAEQTTCTGALCVKGPLAFESGMTGKGGADGGQVMKIDGAADFAGEVTSMGVSLPRHKHHEQGDGNLVSEPR